MIIENEKALRTWLEVRLEPICDADPKALAKYVIALVKKDKSDDDLQSLCIDQLEVFLQGETVSFVNDLFKTVKNQEYLKEPEPKKESPKRNKSDDSDLMQKRVVNDRRDDRRESPARRKRHSSPGRDSRRDRERRSDDREDRERSRRDRDRSRSPRRERSRRDRHDDDDYWKG